VLGLPLQKLPSLQKKLVAKSLEEMAFLNISVNASSR